MIALALVLLLFGNSHSEAAPGTLYSDIYKLFVHGNLAEAQARVGEASREFATKDTVWAWKFRFLEANIRIQQGRSTEALALMEDELPPSIAIPDFAIQRNAFRAIALARLGNLKQAVVEAKKARDLGAQTHSIFQAEAFSATGVVDVESNALTDAAAMFQAGRKAAHAKGDSFLEAKCLINQGVVSLRKEHYDEALDLLGAASAMARTIGAKVLLESSLGNIGWAYHETGDHERALANFQQATLEADKLGTVLDQVRWLNNAGVELWMLGDLNGAERSYRKALGLAESIHSTREGISVEMDLAYLLFLRGNYGAAAEYSDRALASARSNQDVPAQLDLLFLNAQLAAQKGDVKEARRLFLQVDTDPAAWPFHKLEAEDALATLLERNRQPVPAEHWYRTALATFERQRATIKSEESKLPFFSNADQVYADYVIFLIHHHRTREALQLLDLGRARTLQEGLNLGFGRGGMRSIGAVDPQGLARRLHSTLLVYFLGPDESYLWCTTESETRLFKIPKEADVAAQVASYQKAILNSNDVLATNDPAGHALYNALIAPAQSLIAPHSKVFLVPDGVLNRLNFETLLVSTPVPHYWIDDVTVTNASSLRMLESFAAHAATNISRALLLMGAPIPPAGAYEALPGAEQETIAVENHFPSDHRLVLTGRRAFPAAYAESRPEQFSYIHFVAHGTASHLSPLDSAVLLSDNPGETQAFKLYARDIIHSPLHAELVTISACYGSGSRAYSGEGLLGLSWAFLRAGAHHVVGALWEVSDSSTPRLMDRLYAELETGRSPDIALRAAKLSLLHSQGTSRKPLYWAGFELYAGS